MTGSRRLTPLGPGRRSGPLALTAGLLVGALLAPASPTDAGASVAPGAPTIRWTPCPKSPGFRCGTLQVPLDYRHPTRASVGLAVVEHPTSDSQGVVIFNPGGPGESGVLILPLLTSLVPAAVRSRLSLVSFDERGTGSSRPMACGPSPASAGSAVAGSSAAIPGLRRPGAVLSLGPSCPCSPPSPPRRRLGTWTACERRSASASIDYYGLSYGTVLGSVYRQLFPGHVRSMVLDGAVDANLSLSTDAAEEAPAIETALERQLGDCGGTTGCPLGTDPVGFYRDLQKRLSQAPLPPPGNGDTLPVTVGDLATATLLYLSVPTLTPGYLPALAVGGRRKRGPAPVGGPGSGDRPRRVVPGGVALDHHLQRRRGATRTAPATVDLARSLAARYPLGGAEAVSNNLIGCPGWTGAGQAPVPHLTPVHTPTPLVIGNTYDPNTPYISAQRLTSAIGGRLVTYRGDGHTWLLNGSDNACMQHAVGQFLLRHTLPARGTTCVA